MRVLLGAACVTKNIGIVVILKNISITGAVIIQAATKYGSETRERSLNI